MIEKHWVHKYMKKYIVSNLTLPENTTQAAQSTIVCSVDHSALILKWISVMSICTTARTIVDTELPLETKSSTEYSIHSPNCHSVLYRSLGIGFMMVFYCALHLIIAIDRKTTVSLRKHHVLPFCWQINDRFNIVYSIQPLCTVAPHLWTFESFKST